MVVQLDAKPGLDRRQIAFASDRLLLAGFWKSFPYNDQRSYRLANLRKTMPNVNSMDLPKPEDPSELEKMVREAYALKWNSPNLQIVGRRGQAQAGVDVFGEDDLGRLTGIQCKLYSKGLTLKTVVNEISKAEDFDPPIQCLYIASTFPADAELQRNVRLLSRKRVSDNEFPVGLIFWSDIISGLALNPSVIRGFYPQINLDKDPEADLYRLDLCLDLGYFGAHVDEFMELLYGEAGWLAQEDVRQFEVVLEAIENRAARLLPKKQADAILMLTQAIHSPLFANPLAKINWSPIEADAKLIVQRVRASGSFLGGSKEPLALSLGMQLGAMNQHSEKFNEHDLDAIGSRILDFLPDGSKERVETHLDKLRSRDSIHWGSSLLTLVSRELKQLPPTSM